MTGPHNYSGNTCVKVLGLGGRGRFRLGLGGSLGWLGLMSGTGECDVLWLIHESPHEDRSTRMCVCVFAT